jgi:hypothetical protein
MIPEMPLDAGVSPGGNRMLDRSRWNSDEAVALVPLESKGFDEEEEGEDWEEEEWEEDDDWDDDDDDERARGREREAPAAPDVGLILLPAIP